jgi:hypothetical protein
VFDDAHRLCNTKAKPFAACMALPGRVRWALTESPMRNHGLGDLLPLLQCVGFRYAVRFHHPFEAAYARLNLSQLLGNFTMMRASLVTESLPLDDPVRYEALKRYVAQLVSDFHSDRATWESVHSAMLELRRMCATSLGKAQWTRACRERVQRGTLLVISSFSSALQSLAPELPGNVEQLRGGQSQNERSDILARLEAGQLDVFMLTYRLLASQPRLPLQSVSCAVFYDPWWSTGPQERLLTSLPQGALAYQLVCADSVEEHVEHVCWDKHRQSASILKSSLHLLEQVLK